MTVWLRLGAVVAGWMLQLWLTMRQSQAHLRALAQLRGSGTVVTGKAGRRYRGGIAFVSLATDGKRVTGAISLRGFTTFARPAPLPALVGMRLGAVVGDRSIPGLTDSERDAARDAVRMLRSAHRTAESTAGHQQLERPGCADSHRSRSTGVNRRPVRGDPFPERAHSLRRDAQL